MIKANGNMQAAVKSEYDGEGDIDMERGQKRSGEVEGDKSKQKRRKKASAEPKNALIQLNEMKPGLVWELLGQEGAVHEPTFIMQVQVNDTTFTGSGKSKKLAKLNCAENALQSFVQYSNGVTAAPIQQAVAHTPVQSVANPGSKNPVMILNELRPGITYECIGESGDAHTKSFTMQITVMNLQDQPENFQGAGRNKRIAKSHTAQAALQKIFNLEFPPSTAEDVLPIYEGDDEAWKIYKPQPTKIAPGEKNPIMEIHELYHEAKFEFQNIQETPMQPLMMCRVEIEGQVFEGTDSSKKQAKLMTAMSALQYLKDTGLYEERRSQLGEKQDTKKQKKEEYMQQWKERVAQLKEERANRPEKGPALPVTTMGLFHTRFRKAKFNLLSTDNPVENACWKMSVVIDDKLYVGTGRSKKAAKKAAAQSALRYQVEIGAITDDIAELLVPDEDNMMDTSVKPEPGVVPAQVAGAPGQDFSKSLASIWQAPAPTPIKQMEFKQETVAKAKPVQVQQPAVIAQPLPVKVEETPVEQPQVATRGKAGRGRGRGARGRGGIKL